MLWLIALVVVLVLFLINLGKIRETLQKTNFKEVVQTQRSKEPEKPRPVPSAPKVEDELPPAPAAPGGSQNPAKPSSPSSKDLTAPKPGAAEDAKGEGSPGKTVPAAGETTAAEKPAAGKGAPERPAAAKPEAAPVKSRQASLYFVRIDDDGIIVRQEVKRAVPSSDSPLADAMTALLKGPTEDELRRKLLSLVPSGTRLLGAQVRGSTAFLNFSEAFMYNHYGIEGYAGQLKQVVYTATAFPTVQDVQILIEGERHDYLGGEGVYIGRPLSRNSF